MTKQIVVEEKRATSIDWTMKKGHRPGIAAAVLIIALAAAVLLIALAGLGIWQGWFGGSDYNGIEMVSVKGGTFEMGSNNGESDEQPVHRVTVGDFYIGKYEVTQKQWKAVMGSNPSRFKGDNLPVEQVSWNDVQEFIRKLNAQTGEKFRLPTEAEWEYACRGGLQSAHYKYSGSNDANAVAWYSGNSGSKTHAVGQKRPNELGLYDMSGNVWEWCSDWYGSNYYQNSPSTNPKGPSSGSYRVRRGGSWFKYDWSIRAANRGRVDPVIRLFNLGFRLVRE